MVSLFDLTKLAPRSDQEELFEPLLEGENGLLIERIVSHGQTTPENDWYDQERDEWVVVLEGEARLLFADGRETALAKGDHCFIPRHERHRVVYTSSPCIWLAVHGRGLNPK